MALLLVTGLAVVGAGFWLFEADLPAGVVDARYASAASRFMELPGGGRLHYRDQGNPAGPALVLVHGSNASLHTWEPWVAYLGDDFRLITLDLPGHGLTGRVPDDDYGSAAYVETVRFLTCSLSLEQFVLGGNSMGGGVAWRYALRYPETVRGLVLVDASGPPAWRIDGDDADGGDTPLAFRLLRQPLFRVVARYLDPGPLVAQGLRSSFADPGRVDQGMIARYRDLTLRSGTRTAILQRFAAGSDGADETPDLGMLEMPVLILWGAQDHLIPLEVGARFERVLPKTRLVVYPDAGHLPMEEVAERSAADVRGFMGSLPAGASASSG